jgi:regulatory protein
MAVRNDRPRRTKAPLDAEALERIALTYVGRYATSRSRLRAYLNRKLRERGWEGEGEPPLEPLIGRLGRLGYVDDRTFAIARAASLGRRGYGERRVKDALRAAGIEDEDSVEARQSARLSAWEAARRFAERRRLGPFASEEPSPAAREKAFAAMMRAGHSPRIARRLLDAPPGDVPEWEEGE